MAITQVVQNGQLVESSASAYSLSSNSTKSGADLDEMDFLNLLVAEMQYQDPLEPSSNTDYVAQLATFSQVQAVEDMEATMTNMNANNLVGKYVILNVTNSTTGSTSTVSGKVDYVTYEDGKAYLSVNDGLYSIDDLDTVTDENYYNASITSMTFTALVNALPTLSALTASDADSVNAVRAVYDGLTDYEKGFIDSESLKTLETLETRLKELGVTTSSSSEE